MKNNLDSAERIIKINESIEKMQLKEFAFLAPLLSGLLRVGAGAAIRGAAAGAGGAGAAGGGGLLRTLAGGLGSNKAYLGLMAAQGAQAGFGKNLGGSDSSIGGVVDPTDPTYKSDKLKSGAPTSGVQVQE